MLSWLFFRNKSKDVFIVYKLKQNNIDTVIEVTKEHKLQKRLINLKKSNFVHNKITYDYNENVALQKFYNRFSNS